MIRKAVIPAAGFGTRFLPATKSMPKEMLPIVNKPLVQYGVEEAIEAGMTTCALVTGRGKRAIAVDHDEEALDAVVRRPPLASAAARGAQAALGLAGAGLAAAFFVSADFVSAGFAGSFADSFAGASFFSGTRSAIRTGPASRTSPTIAPMLRPSVSRNSTSSDDAAR